MYGVVLDALIRLALELSSAIICFILVWFMIKPYRLTGEGRYLGLPLGFGIMGISHVIAATVAFSGALNWFMLLFRTFSFLFLATTYFFSNNSSKKSQQVWNITFSALFVILMTLSLLVFVAPQSVWEAYNGTQIYFRIFMEIFLLYIIIHTLRGHVKEPDPKTIWIPFGFIFLALSQYSLLVYYIDTGSAAFWGAMVFRFAGLAVFLLVAYQAFYSSKEASINEKDFA
jgi:hypothetical protein